MNRAILLTSLDLAATGLQPAVTLGGANGLICSASGAGKLGLDNKGGIAFHQRCMDGGSIFLPRQHHGPACRIHRLGQVSQAVRIQGNAAPQPSGLLGPVKIMTVKQAAPVE